jgi:hypothetical protein
VGPTLFGDGAALVFDQARHHPHSQTDLGYSRLIGFERAIPFAVLEIDRPELDAGASCVTNQLRGRIEAHGQLLSRPAVNAACA